MANDELRRLAMCMLADYDARTLGKLFSRPVDLTIPALGTLSRYWLRIDPHGEFLDSSRTTHGD
jgi:hypothetical protein